MKTKTIIGKKYVPNDNSWSVNVTDCGDILSNAKTSNLAGSWKTEGVVCTIVSEPFTCITRSTGIKQPCSTHTMIMVEYNKETHAVLYDSKQIQN